ncbi:MAG: thioredoxin family protein [Bacteroidetes bacterium]|nr:thioredoxin family protein [Bacteroidota bacterium]
MKKTAATLLLLILLHVVSAGQQVNGVPDTKQIMADAYAKAQREKKSVFVMFHASWCTWCQKMDASMKDPACSTFFDQQFVMVHLVVDEAKDKKQLETPGAADMRKQYGGEGQGIPYWLMFDRNGKLISDSKLHTAADKNDFGENVGCPASAAEVDFFIGALKKCTLLSAEQESAIRERFRKNEVQ